MKNIPGAIISIQPKYMERILDGSKEWEFRKVWTGRNINGVYLYETAPVSAIVGDADIDLVITGDPFDVYHAAIAISPHIGISSDEYFAYMGKSERAYALLLNRVGKYSHSFPLKKFGIKRPPQNFCFYDFWGRVAKEDEKEYRALMEENARREKEDKHNS